MSGYPDDNPKTAVGAAKVPLHLVPPSASHHLALAFRDGAAKYGPYNWRDHKVSASVYVAAAKRHIDAWWDGEDVSPDAGVDHLAHAMACMAIVLDAASVGKLNDDRPTRGAAAALQARYATPQYGELIPHSMAAALLRDNPVTPPDPDPVVNLEREPITYNPPPNCDGCIAQVESPQLNRDVEREDDEGESIPGYPPGVACNISGECE